MDQWQIRVEIKENTFLWKPSVENVTLKPASLLHHTDLMDTDLITKLFKSIYREGIMPNNLNHFFFFSRIFSFLSFHIFCDDNSKVQGCSASDAASCTQNQSSSWASSDKMSWGVCYWLYLSKIFCVLNAQGWLNKQTNKKKSNMYRRKDKEMNCSGVAYN